MHKSNYRVKNVHMLVALLCGHYIYALSATNKNRIDTNCRKCGVPFSHKNLLIPRNCECSLVIPGK